VLAEAFVLSRVPKAGSWGTHILTTEAPRMGATRQVMPARPKTIKEKP
jgi:hypothetical protein